VAYQSLSVFAAQSNLGVILVYGKPIRKRSKFLTMIMFPVLVFIGIIGLFMYLVGDQKSKQTKKAANKTIKVSTDNVTLIPNMYAEKEQELLNK
jgi:flagellar basal body-associated protein FliL